MISGLDRDGRLVPPGDAATALRRLQQCRKEVDRMLRDLCEPPLHMNVAPAYSRVTQRMEAYVALKKFMSEERQLADWLSAQHLECVQSALDVFRAMREDQADFEPSEEETIGVLEKHVASISENRNEERP